MLFSKLTYEAKRRKRTFTPPAGNEGPDQTAYLRSLIRAFFARLQNLWILQNISTNREGPEQNVQMRRVVLRSLPINEQRRASYMNRTMRMYMSVGHIWTKGPVG